LIFSLAIPPHLLLKSVTAYADDLDTVETPYDSFIQQSQSGSANPPPVRDNFHLNEHQQFHRIYSLDGDQEVLKKEIELGSGLDPQNEFVAVANFDREVRVVYDRSARELRFERFIYNKDLDRQVLTNVHAITNIDIETTDG